jgi:acetolactate synthase I/II/III large subunit
MEVSVGRLVVKYLGRLGTEYIFGIPGAHILPVYDALYHSEIRPVLTKHEQGASFMACGYARQSGKVGVCIATAGPGATNLVTGLANAYVDRLPVLALTGETPTYSFGKGALQESSGEGVCIDQVDIFRGISRYNTIIQRTDYLLNHLRTVTGILLSENPGPVLLSFPFNVLKETVDEDLLDDINFTARHQGRGAETVPAEQIMRLIKDSTHPVVVAGYGSVRSGAEDSISRFSSTTHIPVATSLKARGVIPESSGRCLGVLGITSNETAFRYIAEKADLVIITGASFGERTSYNWNSALLKGKKIIQIDNDASQLNKVFSADVALHCDVKKVFDLLNEKLDSDSSPKGEDEIALYKSRYANHDVRDNEFVLVSHFLKGLNDHFGGEVSIFDDNIIYMQRFCEVSKSGSYFPNSGISALGHAVPAAIGAKLATQKPVVAVLGDGGFQMCCMEIMTAVNYGIPITVILLNNSSLGLVRKNQMYNYGGRFIASDFINPDYGKLAEAFAIHHVRVASIEDADRVFKTVDFKGGINLIELILSKNEFPRYSSAR